MSSESTSSVAIEYTFSEAEKAELARLERERSARVALASHNISAGAQDAAKTDFDQAAAQLAAEKLGVNMETASNAMQLAKETVQRISRQSTGNGPFDQAQQQHQHASAPAARAAYTPAASRLSDLWNASNVMFSEQLVAISSGINESFFWGTKIRPFPLTDDLVKEVEKETEAAYSRNQKVVYSDELLAKVKQHQVEMRQKWLDSGASATALDREKIREAVTKQKCVYHLLCKLNLFETMLLRWASGDGGNKTLVDSGRYARDVLLPALEKFKEQMGNSWKHPATRDYVDFDALADWLPDVMCYEGLVDLVREVFAPLHALSSD